LLFIHSNQDTANLGIELGKLIDNPDILNILDMQYVTYALDSNNKDAKIVKNII
jgi:hypothetical protein